METAVEMLYLKHHHEIHALARALLARERASISTVTLVNELYLKLQGKGSPAISIPGTIHHVRQLRNAAPPGR